MITHSNEQLVHDVASLLKPITPQRTELQDEEALLTTPIQIEATGQLLARSKFIIHHPKIGINPLIDAAAYLFSIIGKLKLIKSYRQLSKLHQELITEIGTFEELAKAQGYSAEYILVSRYALCATLDDLITHTTWGGQGQWDSYSLLTTFSQEPGQQERFFIILEHLIKDPNLYIDLMEFMYLCLNLGFKGSYRSSELSSAQLEQICNALYQRIRAHHGDFNKSLSAAPPRSATPPKQVKTPKKPAIGFIFLTTASIVLALFIGLGYLLDTISNQAYRELMHIGKSILYETHDS